MRQHSAFSDVIMFIQAALYFKRPDPLPGHLDQIIGAALKIVIAIALDKPVTGIDPAIAHCLCCLVGTSPIAGRR